MGRAQKVIAVEPEMETDKLAVLIRRKRRK